MGENLPTSSIELLISYSGSKRVVAVSKYLMIFDAFMLLLIPLIGQNLKGCRKI